jgi:hypothetical protein
LENSEHTESGATTIQIPRDREPLLVPKHLRRLEGFDAKVLALVFAWTSDARNSSIFGRNLRSRNFSRPDFTRHWHGINLPEEKEVLQSWIAESEGANFWQNEKLASPVRTMSEANINAAY